MQLFIYTYRTDWNPMTVHNKAGLSRVPVGVDWHRQLIEYMESLWIPPTPAQQTFESDRTILVKIHFRTALATRAWRSSPCESRKKSSLQVVWSCPINTWRSAWARPMSLPPSAAPSRPATSSAAQSNYAESSRRIYFPDADSCAHVAPSPCPLALWIPPEPVTVSPRSKLHLAASLCCIACTCEGSTCTKQCIMYYLKYDIYDEHCIKTKAFVL